MSELNLQQEAAQILRATLQILEKADLNLKAAELEGAKNVIQGLRGMEYRVSNNEVLLVDQTEPQPEDVNADTSTDSG